MDEFRRQVQAEAEEKAAKGTEDSGSRGYGCKFGVESDRMDSAAVGHDYKAEVRKHSSQTDYAKGFGGKFGVQANSKDKVRYELV